MRPVITFLSDFGVTDDFVGTCHGVMKRIAPDAEIIDQTHGIRPQQVLQGALVLRNTLPYMPEGVHLAVVDPGVGTTRKGIAVRSGDGRLYVGPDNGLLVPAAERMDGLTDAWELADARYQLQPRSMTFHGRDVFAPVAAFLAGGLDPGELGPRLDVDVLVRLDIPAAVVTAAEILARVLIVDRFGNVQLNLSAEELELLDIVPGTRIELAIGLERYYAVAARTFAEVGLGDIVLYEDSYRNIALAINEGAAAAVLSAQPGDAVRIRPRS
jgi:S-adenosylmethionine hydrolase